MVHLKRPPIVFWRDITLLLIGHILLYRVTQSPSFEMYRKVDSYQLLASGACFGAFIAGLATFIWRDIAQKKRPSSESPRTSG
jgi:hypothetical protein